MFIVIVEQGFRFSDGREGHVFKMRGLPFYCEDQPAAYLEEPS